MLSEQDETSPFNMQKKLSNGMEVWKFVHEVALGLHKKRTKRKRVGEEETKGADK